MRVEIASVHVGYLSRETAKDYRSCMGAGRRKVPAPMVMGGPEDTIGVFIGRSSADNQKLRAAAHRPQIRPAIPQSWGRFMHFTGALVMLVSLALAAVILIRQRRYIDESDRVEPES